MTSDVLDVHVTFARRGFDLDVRLRVTGPLVLVGPNGAGKTSFVRAVAGILRPDGGRIALGDTVLYDEDARVCVPPETRRVGYVPQGLGLFPHLSVLENVAYGLRHGSARLDAAQRTERARAVLEAHGALHLADRRPADLSGGEAQRVALARALVIEPAILLLDEPLAALDAAARRSMRTHLSALVGKRSGPTIFVSHDVRDAAAMDAPCAVLEGGRIVQYGNLEDLRAAPATPFVAEFTDLGTPPPIRDAPPRPRA